MTTMTTYEITDADGTRYAYDAEMLDEEQAYILAQRIADREGETVWVHGPGIDEEGMEIDPSETEITDRQIRTLSTEAAVAGDEAQVAICDRALAGDEAARAECARVISDAQAQG